MPTESFDKQMIIAQPPQHIYDYLCHPTHFVRLQPLIKDIFNIEESQDDAGHTIYRYEATEAMSLFGFKLNNHLRAVMTLAEPGRVLMQVAQAPMGVQVKQVLTLSPVPEGTSVNNHIEVTASRPLLGFSTATAKEAHAALLEELKRRMETA